MTRKEILNKIWFTLLGANTVLCLCLYALQSLENQFLPLFIICTFIQYTLLMAGIYLAFEFLTQNDE